MKLQNARVGPFLNLSIQTVACNVVCWAMMMWGLYSAPIAAQQTDCAEGTSLQHSFVTGATWTLCANLDDAHALTIKAVHYHAPGDRKRSVLAELNVGQILLHYHDSENPTPQIAPTANGATDSKSVIALPWTDSTCDTEIIGSPDHPHMICARLKNMGVLAKYAQRPSLHGQSWEIASTFAIHAITWTIAYTFSEDGQIQPSVSLSGRLERTGNDARYSQALRNATDPVTRASILATWRMVFDLDTSTADRIEQFDFPLDTSLGNRRAMQISAIETETLRNVDSNKFRGWRILDTSGAGYYLDPANSGFRYTSQTMNWAQFDVAVTRFKPCERYALLNQMLQGTSTCGDNLDQFISGEAMEDASPVLWYSQMHTLNPSQEDWPVVSDLRLAFDLLPFDWTASSPFEVIE